MLYGPRGRRRRVDGGWFATKRAAARPTSLRGRIRFIIAEDWSQSLRPDGSTAEDVSWTNHTLCEPSEQARPRRIYIHEDRNWTKVVIASIISSWKDGRGEGNWTRPTAENQGKGRPGRRSWHQQATVVTAWDHRLSSRIALNEPKTGMFTALERNNIPTKSNLFCS
jgi:hypothetical protein